MLDAIKKGIAEMRGAEPLTALTDLSAWLDTAKGIPGHEEGRRGEILSQGFRHNTIAKVEHQIGLREPRDSLP